MIAALTIGSALFFAVCAFDWNGRYVIAERLVVALVFVAVLTGLVAICGGVKA